MCWCAAHGNYELRGALSLRDSRVLVQPFVSHEFQEWRILIRKALDGGYRRPFMRDIVQQHLYLLYLRKQEDSDNE